MQDYTLRPKPTFKKQAKKLYHAQKIDLDEAIKTILANPTSGSAKTGDLQGRRVYKFKMAKMAKKEVLLCYMVIDEMNEIWLLALGSRENFYRDLKHKWTTTH